MAQRNRILAGDRDRLALGEGAGLLGRLRDEAFPRLSEDTGLFLLQRHGREAPFQSYERGQLKPTSQPRFSKTRLRLEGWGYEEIHQPLLLVFFCHRG